MDDAPRVFLETFGCQMNRADSQTAMALLKEAGYQAVDDPLQADLVIYNTCAVRDHAEARVRGRLDGWKNRKRPGQVIAVLGCMAQRLGQDLGDTYPWVDIALGSDHMACLPGAVEAARAGERRLCFDATDDPDAERPAHHEGINAWIPVMRGCDHRCSYCIVPTTRGPERSRDPQTIQREVAAALANGQVQITLLGQTVDAYGRDLQPPSRLADLLRLLHPLPGLRRLRFVTSHPQHVDDDLLHCVSGLPKVARHLHIPAQSGSDRILERMARNYSRATYLDLVERARRIIPGVELLSDFIVGFPGESDDDFQATVSLMETVGFDGAFVFMYSPRPGTPAADLEDDVPAAVKRRRCNHLIGLQLAHQQELHQALIDQTLEILIEGPSSGNPSRWQGRSLGNRLVMVPRDLIPAAQPGDLLPVVITAATNLTLLGRPA